LELLALEVLAARALHPLYICPISFPDDWFSSLALFPFRPKETLGAGAEEIKAGAFGF
jgi:hypothetical protein